MNSGNNFVRRDAISEHNLYELSKLLFRTHVCSAHFIIIGTFDVHAKC